MNNTKEDAKKLIAEMIPLVKDAVCEVVVCVPFTDLCAAQKALAGSNIRLGAQNVSWADKGAFTGEISADMLKDYGVEYVILGHSERRQMFGETDATVNKRAVQALKHSLKPIMCVGESESEREKGITKEVVSRQIKAAYEGISSDDAVKTVVAYEPIWAIGTGKTATNEDANETIKDIRTVLKAIYGAAAAKMRIQYGGSMNAANAQGLMSMSDIDGGLIGGASLKAQDFSVIVGACKVKG